MGGTMSVTQAQAQLKMAQGRSKIWKTKHMALTKSVQREVATYLAEGHDAKAAIKAEQILQNINMCDALELVETMLDLVCTRVKFLVSEPVIPEDMKTTMASIIYASERCPVEELTKIKEMFTKKYGKEWAEECVSNRRENVHPKLVSLLKISPPSDKQINTILMDAAVYYNVNWKVKNPEVDNVIYGDRNGADKYMTPGFAGTNLNVEEDMSGTPNQGPTIEVNINPPMESRPPTMQPAIQQQPVMPTQVEVVQRQPTVQATIPANLSGGMQMQLETPCGQILIITLPPNATPGQVIQVPYSPLIAPQAVMCNAGQCPAQQQPAYRLDGNMQTPNAPQLSGTSPGGNGTGAAVGRQEPETLPMEQLLGFFLQDGAGNHDLTKTKKLMTNTRVLGIYFADVKDSAINKTVAGTFTEFLSSQRDAKLVYVSPPHVEESEHNALMGSVFASFASQIVAIPHSEATRRQNLCHQLVDNFNLAPDQNLPYLTIIDQNGNLIGGVGNRVHSLLADPEGSGFPWNPDFAPLSGNSTADKIADNFKSTFEKTQEDQDYEELMNRLAALKG